MSWMIKKIGKREAVRASIESEQYLPENIKAVILDYLQDEPMVPNGVSVEAYGHKYEGENSYYSNIQKLEIQPIDLIE